MLSNTSLILKLENNELGGKFLELRVAFLKILQTTDPAIFASLLEAVKVLQPSVGKSRSILEIRDEVKIG